jgi:hypothetical protein
MGLAVLVASAIGGAGKRATLSSTTAGLVGGTFEPATGAASDCSTDTTLCLADGRFLVEATWTKPDGESGSAHAVALTTDSGYFWFLDANNVEVAVKALNGCAVNGHFWILSAGLTDLAVAVTVTDTSTNQSKTYSNPQGTPFLTISDMTTFAACPAASESSEIGNPEEPSVVVAPRAANAIARGDSTVGCAGSDTVLCLSGRFQVEATWQTTSGSSGSGHAVNLTSESGYFWFFDPSNVELVVKALDACGLGRGQWFFAAGMTTVGVQLRVTDTFTGEVKTYGNTPGGSAAGVAFVSILDTAAFSFCATPTPPLIPTQTPTPTSTPTRTLTHMPRPTLTPTPVLTPTSTPVPFHNVFVVEHPYWACSPSALFERPSFSPTSIQVHVGDSVTWYWGGVFSHSTTSDTGEWDSGVHVGPFTFSHTFTQTGTFPYHCSTGYWQQTPGPNGGCAAPHHVDESGVVIVGP